jgi:hypothetical protein
MMHRILTGSHAIRRALGWRRTPRLIVAALAVTAVMAVVASPASAQYALGCTYTWPNACQSPYYNINWLIGDDPRHAHEAGIFNQLNNGYPPPHEPYGSERYVCVAVVNNGNLLSGWSCNWGQINVLYGGYYYGSGWIASTLKYSKIALYEMVDFLE